MNRSSTQFAQTLQRRLIYSRGERVGFLLLSLLLALLLAIAAWLKPDPSGMGTHRQLGLPGCTMSTFIGIRCPGCGMTTSWAHTMNGDLASAVRANVGGVLLCLLSALATPVLFWIAIRGKPIPVAWFSKFAIYAMLVAVAISFLEWLIRLAS